MKRKYFHGTQIVPTQAALAKVFSLLCFCYMLFFFLSSFACYVCFEPNLCMFHSFLCIAIKELRCNNQRVKESLWVLEKVRYEGASFVYIPTMHISAFWQFVYISKKHQLIGISLLGCALGRYFDFQKLFGYRIFLDNIFLHI